MGTARVHQTAETPLRTRRPRCSAILLPHTNRSCGVLSLLWELRVCIAPQKLLSVLVVLAALRFSFRAPTDPAESSASYGNRACASRTAETPLRTRRPRCFAILLPRTHRSCGVLTLLWEPRLCITPQKLLSVLVVLAAQRFSFRAPTDPAESSASYGNRACASHRRNSSPYSSSSLLCDSPSAHPQILRSPQPLRGSVRARQNKNSSILFFHVRLEPSQFNS